jgi:hypothetical protein
MQTFLEHNDASQSRIRRCERDEELHERRVEPRTAIAA